MFFSFLKHFFYIFPPILCRHEFLARSLHKLRPIYVTTPPSPPPKKWVVKRGYNYI